MMYPIMCKVKYETLHHVLQKRDIWIQIAFSILLNWIVAPFLMVIVLLDLISRRSLLIAVTAGTFLGLLARQICSSGGLDSSRTGTMHCHG